MQEKVDGGRASPPFNSGESCLHSRSSTLFAGRLAARVHGRLVLFEGCGHWWPVERYVEAAAELERFWARH